MASNFKTLGEEAIAMEVLGWVRTGCPMQIKLKGGSPVAGDFILVGGTTIAENV